VRQQFCGTDGDALSVFQPEGRRNVTGFQRAVSAAAGDLILDPFEQFRDERLRDLPAFD
jgi:hypothetical protein